MGLVRFAGIVTEGLTRVLHRCWARSNVGRTLYNTAGRVVRTTQRWYGVGSAGARAAVDRVSVQAVALWRVGILPETRVDITRSYLLFLRILVCSAVRYSSITI